MNYFLNQLFTGIGNFCQLSSHINFTVLMHICLIVCAKSHWHRLNKINNVTFDYRAL